MIIDKFTKQVVLLSKVPGAEDSEALIREHVNFLRSLQGEGKLILCGPFSDHSGGMIVLNASSKEEAEKIAENDPFVISGSRTYQVRTWQLSCEENNHLGMG